MKNNFTVRHNNPKRQFTKTYKQYRSYKKHLAKDFYNRCGYCGDFDKWAGGMEAYHIDHFAPKKKFEMLQNDYNNLVYACPYCNRFKSDDWPSDDHSISVVDNNGFIDPCDDEYEKHLYRDYKGNILPHTALGSYIHKKLHLGLTRHQVLWNLSRLHKLKFQLGEELKKAKLPKDKKENVEECYRELSLECDKYMEYLLGKEF